ncbi:MAG: GAF domain-containing protein [Coriobacteriia bacterium]|nr:GAF domain-containing protein [Coriobacteriia bacterium]
MFALAVIATVAGCIAVAAGSRVVGIVALVAGAIAFVFLLRDTGTRRRGASRSSVEAEPPAAGGPSDAPPAHDEPAPIRVPSTIEVPPLLKALSDAADARGFEVAATHLWLTDAPSATLRLVGACGMTRPPERPVPMDDPVLGHAARGTAAFAEVARISTRGSEVLVRRFAVPLERAHDVPGVVALDVVSEQEPDVAALQEVVTRFLPNLAAALAVHVARQQAEDAEMVLSVARDMSRLLDVDSVISTALDRAMSIAGASTGSVMLYDESAGVLRIVRSVGLPPSTLDTTLRPGEGIAGWVFSTRQPLLIEDLPERPRRTMRHGVRSAVSVPLADEDDVLGVLNVGSPTFLARFTKSHLDTLELIGRQAAIALRNAQAAQKVRELFFQSLSALVTALETKDPQAQGGAERVLEYALAIADQLQVTGDDLDALRIAALLHDLGMFAVGPDVRLTGRTLTTVERGLLKAHPRIAAEIIADLPAMSAAVPVVYHHHERYDGSGYLDGLAGEDIPLGARILAVADAFVAMTSDRPYRPAMSPAQAVAELREKSGTQFDPMVVEAMIRVLGADEQRAPRWGAR